MESITKTKHIVLATVIGLVLLVGFSIVIFQVRIMSLNYIIVNVLYHFCIFAFLVVIQRISIKSALNRIGIDEVKIESAISKRSLYIYRLVQLILVGLFIHSVMTSITPTWFLLVFAIMIFNFTDLSRLISNNKAIVINNTVIWYDRIVEYKSKDSFMDSHIDITIDDGTRKIIACQSRHHCRRIVELMNEKIKPETDGKELML